MIATPEHVALLQRGVEVWNQWRTSHPLLRPNLSGIDLTGAKLQDAYLNGTIFTATVLDEADLRGALLAEANLNGAVLRSADLGGAGLVGARLFQTNLRRANLAGADLRSASLVEADLTWTNLARADLRGADLRSAGLIEADLTRANLGRVNLSGATLSRADLRGANLGGANLSGADLSGADLGGATVGWTRFGETDLSVVKGLDSLTHLGPSTVGLDVIYRSKGNMPDPFLRGAGLPDLFLTFMASLVGQPIEFFSCFIACSDEDRRFCDRLYADLQARGVRTWYIREETSPDGPGWGEIDRSLKVYDKVVVVCSEHALRRESVIREIERALEREASQGQAALFPVQLDDYLEAGWRHQRKADLLERLVGDFRGWESSVEAYEAAFSRLLEAIKEERTATTRQGA